MATLFGYCVSLMFACACVFAEESRYHIKTELTSFNNASTVCQLATPDIIFKADTGPRLNVTSDEAHNMNGNVKYWVGYVQRFASFQYIGCANQTLVNGTLSKKDDLYSITPGICYSWCDTDYIGLSNWTCYCMSKMQDQGDDLLHRDDLLHTECTGECKAQPGVLCGGPGGFVSVYHEIEYLETIDDYKSSTKAFCLSKNSTQFAWSDCGKGDKYVNTSENGKYGTWSLMMKENIKNKKPPLSRCTPAVEQGNNRNVPVWIGEVRSRVITKEAANPSGLTTPGYVEKDSNGDFLLKFGEEQAQHFALQVCLTGARDISLSSTSPARSRTPIYHPNIVVTGTRTSRLLPNIATLKSTKVTTAQDVGSMSELNKQETVKHRTNIGQRIAKTTMSVSTTSLTKEKMTPCIHVDTTSPSTTTTDSQIWATDSTDKHASAEYNTTIGAVVTIAIVCAATILIHIAICIKQKRSRGNNEANADEKTGASTSQRDPIENQPVHNYFILEPRHGNTTQSIPVGAALYDAPDMPVCEPPKDDDKVYSLPDNDDSAYSQATFKQPYQRRQPTDNIYSMADAGDNNIYDHVGEKSDKCMVRTDNIYNTTGEFSDNYNHTDGPVPKRNECDNV